MASIEVRAHKLALRKIPEAVVCLACLIVIVGVTIPPITLALCSGDPRSAALERMGAGQRGLKITGALVLLTHVISAENQSLLALSATMWIIVMMPM